MRGDMQCLHEPFGEAWYQGEEPLWPRLTKDSLRTPGLTIESVWRNMQALAEKQAVFSKDFPHYIDHIWDDEMLSKFRHSFLIRHPSKTIMSMYKHWPDFHPKETGFVEQRALFDRICDRNGSAPPVIDSDDLLESPDTMIAKWCDGVSIPFLPEALSWEPGARDEVSWWDGGSFHENLRNSDGLKPQKRTSGSIDGAPDRVRQIYDGCLQHYEHLYSFRMLP